MEQGPLRLFRNVAKVLSNVGVDNPCHEILTGFPGGPSQHILVCKIGPASSPTIKANTPPGGDHLITPLLSFKTCKFDDTATVDHRAAALGVPLPSAHMDTLRLEHSVRYQQSVMSTGVQ